MRILTRDEAYEVTEPFHDAYRSAHLDSWDTYTQLSKDKPEITSTFDSSTRFHVLNRLIVRAIEQSVPNTVWVSGGPGTLYHVIDDMATVRFKHVNGAGLLPTFNSTVRQDGLLSQTYTGELMDQLFAGAIGEPPTALLCGYQLTQGEDAVLDVMLACHAPELRFNVSLMGGEGAEMLPFPTIDPVQPRVASKLVQKPDERPAESE